jgi:hypothetical protein
MARYFKDFTDLQIPDLLDTSWEDVSWKNDACGALLRKLDLEQEGDYPVLRLWVEYDDIADREIVDHKYQLELLKNEDAICDGTAEVIYYGDDELQLKVSIELVVRRNSQT